jgi:hypothetical protein
VGSGAATSATTGHTAWGTSNSPGTHCIWGTWADQSDFRDKANIKTLSDKLGLQFIKKIRPVSYNWDFRDRYVRECGYEYGVRDGSLVGTKEMYGIIAQEIKQVLEEIDERFDGLVYDAELDAYRFEYTYLIAPLIKAVQELEARVTIIEEKVG